MDTQETSGHGWPGSQADRQMLLQDREMPSYTMNHADLKRGRGTSQRLAPRSAAARRRPADDPPAELQAVIDAMPDAVVVLDADDRVRLTNPVADRLFLGRTPLDRAELLARFEPLPRGAADGRAMTLRPKHLPSRWYEVRTVPIERGEPDAAASAEVGGRIVVIRDVTEGREARAERTALLSILSHELRTPITTIYAGSRVLARRGSTSKRESSEIAADISAEAAHLYDIVEDLLVLVRAEHGALELIDEPVHLQRVVERTVRMIAGRSPGAPLVFVGVADPPTVRGDQSYVEQVVRNLLMSAARFARPGLPVTVRLEARETEVALSVLDRGPELSDRDLEASFSLSDDGPRLRKAGMGIALFVCRRLVEAMRGRIWVDRRAGGGAEFGFALPRYASD